MIDLKLIKYSICDDLHALLQLTEAVRALLYKKYERGWIYDNDEFCLVLFFRTRFLRISPLFGKFPIPLHTAVLGENDGPLQKNRIHQSPTDQTTALSTRLNYGTNFGADRVRNSSLVGDFLLEYSTQYTSTSMYLSSSLITEFLPNDLNQHAEVRVQCRCDRVTHDYSYI